MRRFKTLFLCLSLAAVLVLPLASCNTVAGIGKDTRAAGDAIVHAASH